MNTLLNQMLALLRKKTGFQTCPSFDMIPVSDKSRRVFAVISPEHVKYGQPFAYGNTSVSPFTVDFRISLLVPVTTPASELMEYFYASVLPVMRDAGGVLSEMQADAPKADMKLQKLVYSGLFRFKGFSEQEAQS